MVRHFVTFYSPGTFVAETTEKPIESWSVEQAIVMAKNIKERYDALPYGFRFTTRTRKPGDLDSKVTATGPMYYLGGKVETLAEVKARATKEDRILVSNMECNGWDRIITNSNSWKWTQPLEKTDIVLDFQSEKP
jgi:hypothetical protein